MNRLAATVAFLLLLALPTFADYPTVQRSVRPLQVIDIDDAGEAVLQTICTTTSINEKDHYWLTAAHCLEDGDVFIGGSPARVVMKDKAADVGVLQAPALRVPALKMQVDPPYPGEKVSMVGHPLGFPSQQLFVGVVASLDTQVDDGRYMMFDMTACGGNSGSAVVNAHDEIVSVLQIGFGRGCSSFSGGARWADLIRLVYRFFRH